MTVRKALAALAAATLCAGCVYSPDPLDRTIAYNRTVSGATNQLLLLNIVRASERLPTYYTRLEGDTAGLGITPSANLSLPVARGRTLESDVTTGASGAVTGTVLKSVSTLAGLASGVGLQGSDTNLLTLQTLDDQKYQNGMMTPVSLRHIQSFQDEGYQRDMLFLMFLSAIRVSSQLIDPIDRAVGARCADLGAGAPAGPGGVSLARQICLYAASNPYKELMPDLAGPLTLRSCVTSGSAVPDDPPGRMVSFANDPAREARMGAAGPHPAVCFQVLLNDLLVLGLRVGSAADAPAELVDVVPEPVADNPAFRSQMIQQKLTLRETGDGLWAVCRKRDEANGFTLTFANPEESAARAAPAAAPLYALMGQLRRPPQRAPKGPEADCQRRIPAAKTENTVNAEGLATPDEGLATPDEGVAAGATRPVILTSDKIAFSTRSFEGMIYYLGEATRYENSENADAAAFVRVLGRNPAVAGEAYYETMFYASKAVGSADAAVSVRDDSGAAYAVPKPCASPDLRLASDRVVACTVEYPDDESLQVLTLLNQIWGLQKESNVSPGPPEVVVAP
jgi:hypothetical protein